MAECCYLPVGFERADEARLARRSAVWQSAVTYLSVLKGSRVLMRHGTSTQARLAKDRRAYGTHGGGGDDGKKGAAAAAAAAAGGGKKARETYDEKWIRKQKMGQQDCSSAALPAWMNKKDHWSYD